MVKSSKKVKSNYHFVKFLKCSKKNIRLYQIYEEEWNNNKQAVKEYINILLENKESYDYSADNLEINLDLGYNVNKYLNNGYKIKEVKKNLMILGANKFEVYGSGIMVLEKK